MWKHSENGDAIKPAEIDSVSSPTTVFVRRNFTLVAAIEEKPDHYEYEENDIPKEEWDSYQQLNDTDTTATEAYVTSECNAVLIELLMEV